MKIEFCQSVDVEGKVDVSTEDITSALDELLGDAVQVVDSDRASARSKGIVVGGFVSAVYQCLEGVTDKMIESMSGNTRKVVADALRRQANRFYE